MTHCTASLVNLCSNWGMTRPWPGQLPHRGQNQLSPSHKMISPQNLVVVRLSPWETSIATLQWISLTARMWTSFSQWWVTCMLHLWLLDLKQKCDQNTVWHLAERFRYPFVWAETGKDESPSDFDVEYKIWPSKTYQKIEPPQARMDYFTSYIYRDRNKCTSLKK